MRHCAVGRVVIGAKTEHTPCAAERRVGVAREPLGSRQQGPRLVLRLAVHVRAELVDGCAEVTVAQAHEADAGEPLRRALA